GVGGHGPKLSFLNLLDVASLRKSSISDHLRRGRPMLRTIACAAVAGLGMSVASAEKLSMDPFEAPLEATQGIIPVSFLEFAKIPDADGGEAPRLMHMIPEPGTKRLFVSTMRGAIYSISYDGKKVTSYIDVNAADWKVGVQSGGSERGLQSFAFHPQ